MRVLKKKFFTGTGRLWCDMLPKLLFFAEMLLNRCGGEREVSPQVCALIGNRYNWFAPTRTDKFAEVEGSGGYKTAKSRI